MEPVLLTPDETAQVLSLGRTKMFELIITGQIESVKIGKCRASRSRRLPPSPRDCVTSMR